MKDTWSSTPIAFVTVPSPPPMPGCPFCQSRQRRRTRTDNNGDGSVTQKCTCLQCGERYRVCCEPVIAPPGNDDIDAGYYWNNNDT